MSSMFHLFVLNLCFLLIYFCAYIREIKVYHVKCTINVTAVMKHHRFPQGVNLTKNFTAKMQDWFNQHAPQKKRSLELVCVKPKKQWKSSCLFRQRSLRVTRHCRPTRPHEAELLAPRTRTWKTLFTNPYPPVLKDASKEVCGPRPWTLKRISWDLH